MPQACNGCRRPGSTKADLKLKKSRKKIFVHFFPSFLFLPRLEPRAPSCPPARDHCANLRILNLSGVETQYIPPRPLPGSHRNDQSASHFHNINQYIYPAFSYQRNDFLTSCLTISKAEAKAEVLPQKKLRQAISDHLPYHCLALRQ